MKKLALLAGAAFLVLAACNPADTVAEAYAETRTVSYALLWPAPAADARDGTVHEYY